MVLQIWKLFLGCRCVLRNAFSKIQPWGVYYFGEMHYYHWTIDLYVIFLNYFLYTKLFHNFNFLISIFLTNSPFKMHVSMTNGLCCALSNVNQSVNNWLMFRKIIFFDKNLIILRKRNIICNFYFFNCRLYYALSPFYCASYGKPIYVAPLSLWKTINPFESDLLKGMFCVSHFTLVLLPELFCGWICCWFYKSLNVWLWMK